MTERVNGAIVHRHGEPNHNAGSAVAVAVGLHHDPADQPDAAETLKNIQQNRKGLPSWDRPPITASMLLFFDKDAPKRAGCARQ
jgi:hypothetical protein